MAGNKIATLFAELGFRVNRAGLKQFQTELKNTAAQIDAQRGRAGKAQSKLFADMRKNYTKMRPTMDQMKRDMNEVREAIARGLSPDDMRAAVDMQNRITRDMGKEYERVARQKAAAEKQASQAINNNIKQRQSMYQREARAVVRAEKQKQVAQHRSRAALIRSTRTFDAHAAKLMQVRDSVAQVNRAYRAGDISMERRQVQIRQLTEQYRRLQSAQQMQARQRIGSAGGIYAGGRDPRQVGNHRLISMLHSDVGLGVMAGSFAVAQSSRAYQNYIGMEQGLTAALGGVEEARAEMDFLTELSRDFGVFVGDLGDDYARFAVAAKDTSLTIEDQRDIFKSFSAMGRIMNMSTEDMKGTFRA